MHTKQILIDFKSKMILKNEKVKKMEVSPIFFYLPGFIKMLYILLSFNFLRSRFYKLLFPDYHIFDSLIVWHFLIHFRNTLLYQIIDLIIIKVLSVIFIDFFIVWSDLDAYDRIIVTGSIHSINHAFFNVFYFHQMLFYFFRVNVLSRLGNDDIFLSTGNIQPSFFIYKSQISSMEPAVYNYLIRFFLHFIISMHHIRSSIDDFSDTFIIFVNNVKFAIWNDRTHRASLFIPVSKIRCSSKQRRCFRQSITHYDFKSQILEPSDHVWINCRSSCD